MIYTPTRDDPELRAIAQSIASAQDTLSLNVLGAAPAKPRNGDMAYANGTTWNPTGVPGFHGYEEGAWVKL